ncbi:MAG: radical SAM protein, partial [Rhodospirillaceae bacterium]
MNSVGPKPTLDAVQAEQSVAPTPAPSPVQPPMALLAELTHRCPMRCAYCSNPLALDPVAGELDTEAWKSVLDQAAKMGVLQANFSGGEPALRPDLEQLVAHARSVGLYVNLITSGLPLTQERVTALAEAGLDHVQLALQDITDDGIAAIAKVPAALSHKQAVASWVQETGMALTLNLVITRLNATRVGEMMDMAAAMGAGRCEVANVQYYGWGLRNRAALLPDRDTLEGMISVVEARRAQYQGQMVVDFVLPDYHAGRPKSCMSGWGQRFLNVTPTGKVLPCHAAETVPDLGVETVLERPLAEIWRDGPA